MTFPGTYVLRRLLIAVPSLLGISVVLFTVLALAPGDPFGEIVSNPNIPAEVAANLRLKFGMDDPLAIRYVRWLAAMLHGDWGFSFASRIDVVDLIMQRLPTTLLVVGSSQLLALAVAAPNLNIHPHTPRPSRHPPAPAYSSPRCPETHDRG